MKTEIKRGVDLPDGLYAARKTADRIVGIHIDEEALELDALNRKVKARHQADADRAAARRQRNCRRSAAARRLAKQEIRLTAVILLAMAADLLQLASPILIGIITVCCLVAMAYKAGRYYGGRK